MAHSAKTERKYWVSGEGPTETQRLSLVGFFFFCRINKKRTLQWQYTSRVDISIFKSQVVTMQTCLWGPHPTRCLLSPGPVRLLMCLTLGGANSRQIISFYGGSGSLGVAVRSGVAARVGVAACVGVAAHRGGGTLWCGRALLLLTFPPGPSACVGFSLKLSPSWW